MSEPPEVDPRERRRIARVYRSYATSRRKARSWSAENLGNRAIRAEVTEAAIELAEPELSAYAEVLDIGCGSGWWLELLAQRSGCASSLHGVELVPDRVAAAQLRVPSATIVEGDARRLPYGSGRFSMISMFTVLSSLSGRTDIEVALREARRALSPHGALLIWEPRLPNPLNRHTTLVDRALLARALPEMKTTIRTITVLPPLARSLGPRTERLYPLLARVPVLRSHRLICLRPQLP